MKPLHLALATSLAANLALAAFVFQKRDVLSAPAEVKTADSPAQARLSSGPTPSDSAAQIAAAEALASAARSGNAAGVRDHLRSLGLPEDVVRNVVRATVAKRFLDIQKKFMTQANGAYWRTTGNGFNFPAMTKEQRNQLREANRDAMKEFDEVMGPDPNDPSVSRFAFLPAEKATKARELDRDYSDLRMQILAETEGFRLPADDEKLAFLEKEQRKDLAALLSPEELEAFDMRNSSTANRLRSQLHDLDISESEYKAIYSVQKAFDDKFSNRSGPTDSPSSRDLAQARAQAQQDLNAQLKATLGDDRFNAYLRSQNNEYRTLEAAAKRFNIPQTTVDQLFSARDQILANAQRISSDVNLNPDQQRQALAALAEQTRTQVRTSLGPDVADTYLKNNMRWLDALQRGQPVSITPEGNVYARPNPPGNATNAGVPTSAIPTANPPKG